MPRAEVGTPKYIANQMKSKGLQRLRWYCQVCQKQCRDENGFKCHAQSEAHLRQMLVVGENAGRHISDFSSQFQHDFVTLLSRRFGTKRVKANNVYQEFIQDKNHLHMNATRWVTLTEFVKHLGRTGVARVDETEKGWFLAWIDNSPKALAKQEASMKKERMTTSDEQRERMLLAEQIERAKAEAGGSGSGSSASPPPVEEVALKRDEGEKVVLSFAPKAPVTAASTTSTPSVGLKLNPLKPAINPLKANPLKANPLKRPNVFKQAAAAQSQPSAPEPVAGKKREPSAAERLMFEDQERKRRRMEREAGTPVVA
ncbi:domain of Kin17 curved DNA-binding protein-domain-containing protein [Irpex lacteus]|nr:domain of Kin17 curved DNA-binding protein-domain-containing protein [Irpex lacteus]